MKCLTIEECDAWRDQHSRRRVWKRQTTCVTPLKQLPGFTKVLVTALTPFREALVIVDQVVFDMPPKLTAIRGSAGEIRPVHSVPGHLLGPESESLRALLEIVLADWIDFRVFFCPPNHAMRADHDEYTTVFSVSSGKIAEVEQQLLAEQVRLVSYAAPVP